MTETYYPAAFAEGEARANELKTRIDALVASAPQGFRFEVENRRFKIYAPHNICVYNRNGWGQADYKSSVRDIENVSQESLADTLNFLVNEVKEYEKKEGYAAQLQKLFPVPPEGAKSAPQPEPAKKKTDEEEREERIRKIEKEIADEVSAIELATSTEVAAQVKVHEDELEYLRKKLAAVRSGYSRAAWDENKYKSTALEEYNAAIPVFALQSLQKAQQAALFDDFRVWKEQDSDPLLVGRICRAGRKTPYTIAVWG